MPDRRRGFEEKSEQERERREEMEEEKRLALLIDADNVSPKYIGVIMKEAQGYGNVTIRRIYGDWTEDSKASWRSVLLENSLSPIQQYSYTTGKNSSDSAMIIDAMDILYTSPVDGFIIVSSHSDFTKLAMRLRESGKSIIGMGESKTPVPFRKACEQFKILDVLYRTKEGEHKKQEPEKIVSDVTDLKVIKAAIYTMLEERSDEDGWVHLSALGDMLQKLYSDFDCRNYGYSRLTLMMKSFPELETRKVSTKKDGIKVLKVRKRIGK